MTTMPGPATPVEWAIFVRNADRQRVAELDDQTAFDFTARVNAVGTWTLETPFDSPAATKLLEPHAGIIVRANGEAIFSGPRGRRGRTRAADSNKLTFTGFDDNVWLARRLVHPQPATAAPPYDTDEHDTRTGVASTVLRAYVDANLGPGALTDRRVPGLTIGTDPVAGDTITGEGRWQQLLEFLADRALAGGGLGFRIVQVGTDLEFQVYEPTDLTTSIRFSEGMGNVAGFGYSEDVPEGNYVVCAGAGEGTARRIVEGEDSTSITEWGRIEMFRDRRDTDDPAVMANTIDKELEEKASKTTLAVNPIDLTQMSYPDDYGLGDRVTSVIDGTPIQELVQQVHVRWAAADAAPTVTPTVGTPGRKDILRIFTELRGLRARIADLERR